MVCRLPPLPGVRPAGSTTSTESQNTTPGPTARGRNAHRDQKHTAATAESTRGRDRTRELPPPLALYPAPRPIPVPARRPAPRWVIPILVVALILAAGVAAAAYWPFPRPTTPPELVASIQIDHARGPHPLQVSVTANVSGGTPPYSYNWTFGDGASASTQGATHTYFEHGTFQVLLRATDHDNRTAAAGVMVTVTPVRERPDLLNASNQALGPGTSNAWVSPVSIPASAVSAWLNGSTNVTACSLGGNCDAYVEILNAYDAMNLTHGKAVTNPIWCAGSNGTCQANRTIGFAVNLDAWAGQTVYLAIFNNDVVWSQTVSARATMDCWY